MWRCSLVLGFCALLSAQAPANETSRLRLAAEAIDEIARTETPTCDNVIFVRRSYLEIVGRVPTAAECRSFLDSPREDKRDLLIDELLAAPGHSSRMFWFWADLLRVRTVLKGEIPGLPYINWLKQSIVDDKPYDEMVREMLTAEGPARMRGKGATGYFLRDRDMPESSTGNTLRALLGTRIECAQCHNHPFDAWTQRQFYEMTAFTGGITFQRNLKGLPNTKELRQLRREVRASGSTLTPRAFVRFSTPFLTGVYGSGTGLTKLPVDYQYNDAGPDDWVVAHELFGNEATVEVELPAAESEAPDNQHVGSREVFANWMTSVENPLFTKTIVNRLWKRSFGKGLIEPVDDLRFDSVASNQELLLQLEELMIEVDYHVDEFLRVVYRTRAWQAERPAKDLQRMSAEQAWDSVLTLVIDGIDETLDPTGAQHAEKIYSEYEQVGASSVDELRDRVDHMALWMLDPVEFMKRKRFAVKVAAEERQATNQQQPELMDALWRARRNGDYAAEQAAREKLLAYGIEPRRTPLQQRLARASELGIPAPSGHFLRRFGQSNHDQINSSHSESSVPQALSLLNGILEEHHLQWQGSYLKRLMQEAESHQERIDTAYLAVLSRHPHADELELWLNDFNTDPEQATLDLLWILINSHEFLFVR